MTQQNRVQSLWTNMAEAQGASLVFLRRMLWRHFIAEGRWVLEWIRIPSDACMWTWKFLNPERKRCGFKNIRICVDGALVSIEKTVFDHIFKHFEVRQKFSAWRRIFNSLLGVSKCGQSRFFVFDIFLQTIWHLPLVNFVKACNSYLFVFQFLCSTLSWYLYVNLGQFKLQVAVKDN